MKKWAFILPLSFCLLSTGTSFASSSDSQSIIVTVNEKVINFDVQPINDQGTVFVPIRFIVDELGGNITSWKDNEISLKKGITTVTLGIGSTTVYKNQQQFSLTAAPKLINGRTLVPLRFLSEALGASVNYENNRISISTDDTKQSLAVRGNSIGNLNNGGWYATDNEWIYFNNQLDSGKLYKEKMDGSESQKISDDQYVGYLNIVNEGLYYTSDNKLFKSDLDGSNRMLLKDFGIGLNFVTVVGDWIYYTEGSSMFKPLYRMKTDGTSKVLLEKYGVSSIAVSGGQIFYTIDARKLFVMNTDGSKKKKLLEGSYITWVDVKDQSLLFNYDKQLYTMRIDGTSLTKISEHNAQNINVQGDWLYYSNYSEYSKKLYRINLIDKTTQKLSDNKTFYLHILGNKIFFLNANVRSVEEIIVD
ncbi:DUF5050 domain-containing protein [Paenibacillus durus]|uniref:Copper amine oxidase-like N-terminal domain-containing protein n=1 Tax=Paenibacillus durus TaxID=44251 RepID=A0A089HSV7_PAEDU|nr:DUF5050 domain-containing protein [Paenibacillus durus]AIQ13403.1 hypothetical protein PDUR_16870 [Paenibacillus durus]